MISKTQNVETEAFKVGFTLLKIKLIEKFNLKIKPTKTKILTTNSIQDIHILFSFQMPFEF